MANRRDSRIEPSFEGSPRAKSSDGFSVSEEDRVVPANRKSAAKRKSAKAKSRNRGRDRNRRGLFPVFGRLLYWCFVLCIWGGIAAVGIVVYYGAKMPAATTWSIPDRAPNIKIVSVDGQLIANRGMSGGEAVGLHEMSPYIPEAVVAIEDRRFYSHFGIDPIGLSRAMVTNVLGGHFSQGGSTLTQQLAKNLFLTPDRTLERKVQEVLLALWLEHKHSKDQILEMYLNRVYFGSGAYGVEAASRRYFGKSARDVSLSEAALLAGLLKAPSRLSPARDPKAAEERAQLVLAAMREEGKIGDKEYKMALSAPATRAPSYWTGSENYVADTVMEELPDLIGDVRGDIVIDTTVDLTLQKLASSRSAGWSTRAARSSTSRKGRWCRSTIPAPCAPWSAATTIRPASSTAPRKRGASRARPSSLSSTWRRWKPAARRTACATTRRSRLANGHPTITAANIMAR